jgi:hypothetical protein
MGLVNITNEFEGDPLASEEDQAFQEQVLDSYNPPDICFHCGAVLGDDLVVHVIGCGGLPIYPEGYDPLKDHQQLWLHVQCAHDLALDLLNDFLKAENERKRIQARRRLGPSDEEEP